MRSQLPVTLPPYNEPEPDGAIVVGTIDDYRTHHPGGKDLLCVIEVADSSLRQDRTIKLQIYAGHGIPMYVIINLPERCVEVYTQSVRSTARYGQSVTLSPKDSVAFPAAGARNLTVGVRRLLPDPVAHHKRNQKSGRS